MENGNSYLRTTIIFPYLVTTVLILLRFNACFGAQVSSLKLHVIGPNPDSRAVVMLIDLIGIRVKIIDALEDDVSLLHDFSEVTENPRQPPVLMDGKLILDAHDGILQYLVDTYGSPQHEYLYPRNETQRALVDQMLLYQNEQISTAYNKFLEPLLHNADKIVTKERIKGIIHSYEDLEMYLTDNKYLAGNSMTIADLAIYAAVTNMVVVATPQVNLYPKLYGWMNRMSQHEFTQKHNKRGADLSFFVLQNVLRYTPDAAKYMPKFNGTNVDYEYIVDNIDKLNKQCSSGNGILSKI